MPRPPLAEERRPEGGTSPSPLDARIAAALPDLGPQERRAADFMSAHLADLAGYSAAELARMSGVSKATVSRLYRRLGFDDADEVRAHLRALRSGGLPVLIAGPVGDDDHLARETANLRAALAAPDREAVAERLAGAGRVLVAGFRNGYPMALHLREQLAQARPGVDLAPAPGQTLAEELAALGPGDAVVLFGIRRRPAGFDVLVRTALGTGADVVVLAEPGARIPTGATRLEVPVDAVGPFDSYAAVASLISALAARVLELRPDGPARVAAIATLAAGLGELER